MKKIVMIALLGLFVLNASAQKVYRGHYYRPRTYVRVGVMPYYSYGLYSPYWYYPAPGYYSRPSRLDMKLEDIKADYRDRIRSARHDKSLSRAQRRETIRTLKSQRDKELRETQANYYKQR